MSEPSRARSGPRNIADVAEGSVSNYQASDIFSIRSGEDELTSISPPRSVTSSPAASNPIIRPTTPCAPSDPIQQAPPDLSDLPLGLSQSDGRFVNLARYLDIPRRCGGCGHGGRVEDLVYCKSCSLTFHSQCWPTRRRHKESSRTRCQQPTPLKIHIWVKYILFSNVSKTAQFNHHVRDIYTKWFGVPHYQDGQRSPRLIVWPRMKHLLQCEVEPESRTRSPSLCSFFGETGAGKSTVIRALIRLQTNDRSAETPVPGTDESLRSTSGDVHLYADPATIAMQAPILYADCEGLRGDTRPLATDLESQEARIRQERTTSSTRNNIIVEAGEAMQDYSLRQMLKNHEREAVTEWPLLWRDVAEKSPLWRRKVVANLYPRFLYMFSDVVCYATRNARTTTADLTDLVSSAATGYDRLTNQHFRPALLIIINNDSRDNVNHWCDVDNATEAVLENLDASAWFDEQRHTWNRRGREISSARELLLCYYESLRVVFIPSGEAVSTKVIFDQFQKLYAEIQAGAQRVQSRRRSAVVNPDIETLTLYTELAFQALSENLEGSVDFYDIMQQVTKLPQNLTEHLVNVLVKKKKKTPSEEHLLEATETQIKKITSYPCVAKRFRTSMTSTGHAKLGSTHLLHGPPYDRSGSGGDLPGGSLVRCVNTLHGHQEKGHQFPLTSTRQMYRQFLGVFQSTFQRDELIRDLRVEVRRLQLGRDLPSIRRSILELAKVTGLSQLKSNTTCYICFCRMPTHSLPCGHSFCDHCLQALNENCEAEEEHLVILSNCPLHVSNDTCELTFRLKPRNAGVRILTLDGGGVRGILELCILEALVEEVGFGIPIQEMFDLVLGTSAGGIIALGLFKEQWDIETALQRFRSLTRACFEKRPGTRIPIFRHVAQLLYSYRYDSNAIDNALQKAFRRSKSRTLFGSHTTNGPDSIKVGVVSMSGEDNTKPCLLANYSRDWGQHIGTVKDAVNEFGPKDYLLRAENPRKELLTWQAARCTSAAPTYFKQYFHSPTKRTFVDGALRFNNPIAMSDWERKLVWAPEIGQMQDTKIPDIMLSIGAGVQTTALRASRDPRNVANLLPNGVRGRVRTLRQMYRATLDCENQYNDFSRFFDGHAEVRSRCHRLNIVLPDKPCELDDVDQLEKLEDTAIDFLKPGCRTRYNPAFGNAFAHIRHVASRLRASLFYFDVTRVRQDTRTNNQDWEIKGLLRCRLNRQYSRQFLDLLHGGDLGPLNFRVRTRDVVITGWAFPVNEWHHAKFTVSASMWLTERKILIWIEMRFGNSGRWEAISGFPRVLEDSTT